MKACLAFQSRCVRRKRHVPFVRSRRKARTGRRRVPMVESRPMALVECRARVWPEALRAYKSGRVGCDLGTPAKGQEVHSCHRIVTYSLTRRTQIELYVDLQAMRSKDKGHL